MSKSLDAQEWFQVIVDFFSLFACIWLLLRLRRLPDHCRRRLFPRQVVVLASADALFAIIDALQYTVRPHLFFETRPMLGLALRHVLAGLFTLAFTAMCLAELGIAIGFLLQALRLHRLLQALNHGVWLTWGVAAGLTALQLRGWTEPQLYFTFDTTTLAGFCFVLILSAHALLLVQTRRQGSRIVFQRSWSRARTYLLNFSITFFPIVMYRIFLFLSQPLQPRLMYLFGGVATVFLNMNGLINVMTYFFQSRYAKQAILARMPARGQSFQVQFGGVTIADLDWSQSEAEEGEDVDEDVEKGAPGSCSCREDAAGLPGFLSHHSVNCSDA